MNGATARTLREFVGLSRQQLAQQMHVETEDVRAWEDDKAPVPERAATTLEQYLAVFNLQAEVAIEQVEQMEDEQGQPPKQVQLGRYRDDKSARRAGMAQPAPGMRRWLAILRLD